MRAAALDISIGAATVILSTLGFLLGSPTLAVLALVVGSISFGLTLGTRNA